MNEISREIELEFLREELYTLLLNKIHIYLKSFVNDKNFTDKETSNILLRYFFNRNITRDKNDDSIFITSKKCDNIAKKQIIKDLKYYKIKDCEKASNNIEYWWEEMSKIFNDLKKEITFSEKKFMYKRKNREIKLKYGDFEINMNQRDSLQYASNINKISSFDYYVLYILNMRYSYIKLNTHGLSRDFYKMGYNKYDDVTEGFASHFNHYFNKWCSAFKEEKQLGSLGSFFEMKEFTTRTVYVNPPFDQTLMEYAIDHVINILKENKKKYEFIFTYPDWDDFHGLEILKKNKHYKKSIKYRKGELYFIDYMKNKMVYPCDIIEIYLEN